jgi:hypothetical protein
VAQDCGKKKGPDWWWPLSLLARRHRGDDPALERSSASMMKTTRSKANLPPLKRRRGVDLLSPIGLAWLAGLKATDVKSKSPPGADEKPHAARPGEKGDEEEGRHGEEEEEEEEEEGVLADEIIDKYEYMRKAAAYQSEVRVRNLDWYALSLMG